MIHNKPIVLSNPKILPGGTAIRVRSYSVGRENYVRFYKNETMNVSVTFDTDRPAPEKVQAHFENFAYNKSKISQVKLQKIDSHHFALSMQPKHHGVSRFKIKYRVNHKWHWDCHPFSYFMVDPIHLRQLRVYSFIPNANGHLGTWCQELKRISDMGYNTVHLLPLSSMGFSQSPYAAHELFGIDPSYLDPNDSRNAQAQLENFIDTAVKLGIRLCFDLVFNNIGVDSVICDCRQEWLTEDAQEPDGIKRGGWHDGQKWHKWDDLAFLNFDTPCSKTRADLWKYMSAYALYWAYYAAKTGGMIRLDNLHSSHKAFMRRVLGEIREAYPNIIVFGELFDTEEHIETMVTDYGLNFLLATPWEHKYVPQLRHYVQYLHKKHKTLRYLFPICSHDSGSPTQEFGDVRSTTPRLALSSFFGPGPSGIVQGVEYGYPKKISFIGKGRLTRQETVQDFSSLITQFNKIIEENDVFQSAGNLYFIDNDHHAVMGACRFCQTTKKPKFLVFCNFDILSEHKISIDLMQHNLDISGAKLVDLITSDELFVQSNWLELTLSSCGVKVLKIC